MQSFQLLQFSFTCGFRNNLSAGQRQILRKNEQSFTYQIPSEKTTEVANGDCVTLEEWPNFGGWGIMVSPV